MLDLIGNAIKDYYKSKPKTPLLTETNLSEEDEMPIEYFFRPYKQMPLIEQKALKMSKGNILDVGCGAGSHSLYLQAEGKTVTAIDVSPNSIDVANERGVSRAIIDDIFEHQTSTKYDTILLLMNGTGIAGTLENFTVLLEKLKKLLAKEGQILIDSSDIIYMFDQDEDGGVWMPSNGKYYGELEFTVKYNDDSESFPWLYLDYNTLQNICHGHSMNCELIIEGDHYDYLARISF